MKLVLLGWRKETRHPHEPQLISWDNSEEVGTARVAQRDAPPSRTTLDLLGEQPRHSVLGWRKETRHPPPNRSSSSWLLRVQKRRPIRLQSLPETSNDNPLLLSRRRGRWG